MRRDSPQTSNCPPYHLMIAEVTRKTTFMPSSRHFDCIVFSTRPSVGLFQYFCRGQFENGSGVWNLGASPLWENWWTNFSIGLSFPNFDEDLGLSIKDTTESRGVSPTYVKRFQDENMQIPDPNEQVTITVLTNEFVVGVLNTAINKKYSRPILEL